MPAQSWKAWSGQRWGCHAAKCSGAAEPEEEENKDGSKAQGSPGSLEAAADRAAARGWRISHGFWPVRRKHSLQIALIEVRNWAAESRAVLQVPPPDSMGLTGDRSEGEGVGEKTTSSYGLCWHKEMGCRGLGLKAALQSLGKRAARSQNCCKREGSRILAPPTLSGSAHCAHPTPKQEHASGLQVRGSMLLLCWEPSTGATEERAPLTCRSVWCRMMFSCLLTLETAGAAVGDKAACCCSLCSIS